MPKNTHGGNIHSLHKRCGQPDQPILDFSANINPLGPPPWLRQCLWDSVEQILHYPEPEAAPVLDAAASAYGVARENIVAGNGSTELLYLLPRVLDFERALIPVPSYVDYDSVCRLNCLEAERLFLVPEEDFRPDLSLVQDHLHLPSLVFLGRPNNPTGLTFSARELRDLARANPRSFFVVDEAFADFVPGLDRLYRDTPANVLVLLSLTKFYALPGLRSGLAIGSREVVADLARHLPPWSVNALAQAVSARALRDREYAEKTRERVPRLRSELAEGLGALPGLRVFPGEANYLLCRLEGSNLDAFALQKELLAANIAVRTCADYPGLDRAYFRVAVRPEPENDELLSALGQVLTARSRPARSQRTAQRGPGRSPVETPALMFQGTSSNAGKSVLAAAMCRILFQDGYRVAPFKAQNMSLNSFVTLDGGEMGRAQVLQAQACRLEPSVLMNPILLKPSTDTGSQVIVHGRPVRNMEVQDYIQYKREAGKRARDAYNTLASESDVIVLEGAGSPAEINLKAHDLTNMAMAGYSRANVLLVGDIDRGGVFASFVGTMSLLDKWERDLVSGFVINRFRGRADLLDPAIEETERLTGKPVLGTVPYISDLGLPEEDSVPFKAARTDRSAEGGAAIVLGCLDLPHISNFTDIDPLLQEPDVAVRIIRGSRDLDPPPDALVIPGSKNVMADLARLNESDLGRALCELVRRDHTVLVGICGGLQMLGQSVADPWGLESPERETLPGLSLLPLVTEMAREKTLSQCRARHLASEHELKGYEIHHGRTRLTGEEAIPAIRSEAGEIIGYADPGGRVWGTYLHGVFDADGFRRWFIDRLRLAKGLDPLGHPQTRYDLEDRLDALADMVRNSLDMRAVYAILERSPSS
jgi:cobyric acid synthase CobQ/L-threonine-O-3-phosphate decarboxylase